MGALPQHPDDYTKYAFTFGGVDYFESISELNPNIMRYFAMIRVYEELKAHTTKELMHQVLTTAIECIEKKKYEKAYTLLHNLKDREVMIFEPEVPYKLASIVFFDAKESAHGYNEEYCKDKIERWKTLNNKSAASLAVFFCSQPVKRYLGFLAEYEGDLAAQMKRAEKMTEALILKCILPASS